MHRLTDQSPDQLLHLVVRNAPIILWSIGAEGTIVLSEGRGLEMQGWRPGELVGRSVFEVYANAPDFLAQVRRALQGEEFTAVAEAFGRTYERHFTPVVDEDGRVTGVVGISTDITEGLRADAERRASEARYRTLVEGSLQGIGVTVDGQPVFANRALARMFGYEDEATYLNVSRKIRHFQEPTRSQVRAQQQAIAAGKLDRARGEVEFDHRSGERRCASYELSRIEWDGAPAVLAVLVDITEHRRAEETLRQTEWELSRAQQVANIGTWYEGLRNGRISWSDQMYRILERDPAAGPLASAQAVELFHPDDRAAMHDFLRTPPEHPLALDARLLLHTGSERWVRIHAETLFDGNGEPEAFIGTTQDVSERKETEKQLVQAQKMESVGRLSGGVAHDFNNLLTIIQGNLQLLQFTRPDDEEIKGYLEPIQSAAERGAALTRLMLAYARRQTLAPRPVHMSELLDALATLLRRTLHESIDLAVTHGGTDLWPVLVDGAQLESALVNLAVNAGDAMPDGGRLLIECHNVQIEGTAGGGAHSPPPGDYVVIEVRDTGEGIPEELQERVFEPFFTTKGAGRGTGLGLSMVYGFITQSGGHVELESTAGVGTLVRLYLPRLQGEETAERRAGSTVGRRSRGDRAGGRVLVIEDDRDIRELAARYFQELGFDVRTAEGGDPAKRMIETCDTLDILFADVVLPGGFNGAQLARIARARCPQLAVLLTTGYTEDSELASVGELEDVALLPKPYTLHTLTAKLHELGLLGG